MMEIKNEPTRRNEKMNDVKQSDYQLKEIFNKHEK